MNILITIGWPLGQGGHINSTIELVREIKKINKSLNFYLLAPDGDKSRYFKELDVKIFKNQNHPNIYFYNFFYLLDAYKLIFKHKIDLIHCMDYKSLKPLTYLNLLFRKPIIFTKAGGPPSMNIIPSVSNFIVYSDELKDHYKNSKLLLDNKEPKVIKARINNKNYQSQEYLKIDGCLKIFVAMRLKNEKKGLLDNLFSELSQVTTMFYDVEVNIAGDGELINFYKNQSESICKINSKIKVNFLNEINCKKTIDNYIRNSHLVVGHGRGILEPMASGKAVVILGFNSIGSILVNSKNVDRFSYHNFSGRNLKKSKNDISLKELIQTKNVEKLLINQNTKYIKENYDASIGAQKTLILYSKSEKLKFNFLIKNLKWMLTNQFLLLTKLKKIFR